MTEINKAVVLAAGRGTRMRELTAEVPKPMIEVRGKPVLQHIVEGLQHAGIRECLLVVGYRADAVQNFFGNGSRYNVGIQYATQKVQDGTGRVVDLGRDFVGNSPFILSYGDILVDPANYKPVANLPGNIEAIVTVTRGEDVSKGGAVFVNDRMELLDVREKSDRWSVSPRRDAPPVRFLTDVEKLHPVVHENRTAFAHIFATRDRDNCFNVAGKICNRFVICWIDQDIAVAQNKWRIADEIAAEIDNATCPILYLLSCILNADVVAGAVTEKILHRIGAVANDKKTLAYSCVLQSFNDVL